jgi:hypothetical protein
MAQDVRFYPKESEPSPWLSVGIFLVAIFPVLGSALSLAFKNDSRRVFQIFLLSLGCCLVARHLGKSFFIETVRRLPFKLMGAFLIGLLVTCVVNAFLLDERPKPYEIVSLLMICCWVVLSVCTYAFRKELFNSSITGDTTRSTGWVLFATGALIAFAGWYSGPTEPRDAHLSFGGSTITLGVCGIIGYFCTLFVVKRPFDVFASVPWAYLFVFSTARTPILIAGVLFVLYGINLLGEQIKIRSSILSALGVAGFHLLVRASLVLLLICGIAFRSKVFPYNAINLSEETIAYREQELVRRASRFYRILPLPAQEVIPSKGSDAVLVSRRTWQPEKIEVFLDLKYVTSLYSLDLSPSQKYSDLFPDINSVELTVDGQEWHLVKNEQSLPGPIIKCNGVRARYIKISYFTKELTANRFYGVIGQISVYGYSELAPIQQTHASSTVNQSYESTNAVDLNEQTFWHSAPSVDGRVESLSLEMFRPTWISCVKLLPASNYTNCFPTNITIEGTLDGSSWLPITAMKDFAPSPATWLRASFAPTKVRGVRVRGESRNANKDKFLMIIAEIEVLRDTARDFQTFSSLKSKEIFLLEPNILTWYARITSVGDITPHQTPTLEQSKDQNDWKNVPLFSSSNACAVDVSRGRYLRLDTAGQSNAIYEVCGTDISAPLAFQQIDRMPEKNMQLSLTPAEPLRQMSTKDVLDYVNLIQTLQSEPEDRWSMFRSSFRLTLARVAGFWPRPFQELSGTGYRYPHNFVLEVAYYCGWVTTLVIVLGLFIILLSIAAALMRGPSTKAVLLGVAIIAYSIRMQFSSDLIDHANLLLLCSIWVFSRSRCDGQKKAAV